MLDPNGPCSTAQEDVFGPRVSESCLLGFDFTLLFEETILAILPLCCALLLSAVRIKALWGRAVKARHSWLFPAKALVYAAYIALHIALLGLWSATTNVPTTRATLATAALTFVGYGVLLVLSYMEHVYSVRPSTLLCSYLALSGLFDIARTRTLFYMPANSTIAPLFLTGLICKAILLLLESWEKRRFLVNEWKDASPEDVSGIFNRAFFLWLNPLFLHGFRHVLSVDSLPPIDKEIKDASRPDELIAKWQRTSKDWEHALLWLFVCHYKWALIAGVLPRLAYIGFEFAQPFLVQTVLDYIDDPYRYGDNTYNVAYGLVGAYAIVYIGLALSYVLYEHKTYRILTIFRGSLITLIFNKTLRISTTSVSDAEAVTLMSADIDRIGLGLREIHEWWAAFIELALSLWLLERLLGVAMAASTVWIILCLIVGMPLAVIAGNAQTPWLEAIEKRLATTASVLGSMTGIKLTGLAPAVSAKIRELRQKEIRASLKYRFYTALVISFSFASSGLAPVFGFGLYILLAQAHGTQTLTSSIAFSALTLFALQDRPLVSLVDGFSEIQIVINSFRRIQQHLVAREREDCRLVPSSTASSSPSLSDEPEKEKGKPGLDSKAFDSGMETAGYIAVLKDACAGYSKDAPFVLNKVAGRMAQGKITMVVGPVGSGKSTLLRMLLGETPESSGTVWTSFTRAAYCSQSPWMTFGTVQQNILGMSLWDKPWYLEVVKACGLARDFDDLPAGDATKVGTRGARLSGGQQMRVSFARALYSRLPVMILDDVLTGLDKVTERHILETVFSSHGLIRTQAVSVVMATNSASHLQYADHIIVLNEKGQVEQAGDFASLRASPGSYVDRLASTPPVMTERKPLELSDDTLDELGLHDDDAEEEEAKLILRDPSRKTGDLKVYAHYFATAGWWEMTVFFLTVAAFVFSLVFPTVWVQLWTDSNDTHGTNNVGYWLGVYGALAVLTVITIVASNGFFMLWIVPKTARIFHERLLQTTMRATTAFLTSTDSGKTTNRFSQDLELIDNDLPSAFESTAIELIQAIAEMVLVFIGSGYVSAAIPAVLILVYVVQTFYLRTSRQLRLLDIEAKAPLFSQFLETLDGIVSIRAYGWGDAYMARNYEVLDRSQKPYYLLWSIQRWLTLVLDLFVAGIAILLVAIATNVRNGSTAFLGVALFNIVSFGGTLQSLVMEWVEVETAIGAVNRIRTYVATTRAEDQAGEDSEPPASWPSRGSIEFRHVSAAYETCAEPVLKDATLRVEPGEKIGLCGRTGSGKSSLVSTLARMLEVERGSVLIDDIDVSTIPRQVVRERLITLPQLPFFLHGTVRANLDVRNPDNLSGAQDSGDSDDESDSDDDEEERQAKKQRRKERQTREEAKPTPRDEACIAVLQSVGLWEHVRAQGGLSAMLDAQWLSHGQRQLFCLARAVLQADSSPIFVMDEGTANVDAATEAVMQRVLWERFQNKTWVVVAHRLDTVMELDTVVVLDKGRIVETGRPRELLRKSNGAFAGMVQAMKGHSSSGGDGEAS